MENKVVQLDASQEYPIILTGSELSEYYNYLSKQREAHTALAASLEATLLKVGEQIEKFNTKIEKDV